MRVKPWIVNLRIKKRRQFKVKEKIYNIVALVQHSVMKQYVAMAAKDVSSSQLRMFDFEEQLIKYLKDGAGNPDMLITSLAPANGKLFNNEVYPSNEETLTMVPTLAGLGIARSFRVSYPDTPIIILGTLSNQDIWVDLEDIGDVYLIDILNPSLSEVLSDKIQQFQAAQFSVV